MVRIQYASDLHLEFAENSSYLKHHPLIVAGDILLLAGDVGYIGDDNYSKHPFWDWASDNFEKVIVIPGNHEFYKMFDIDKMYNGWKYPIRSNVCCYYNTVIPLRNDVELIATTLWSMIEQKNAFYTESAITDFRRIRYGSQPLDWNRFNEEHERCVDFLTDSIERSSAKHILVASHHVPSFDLMSPEFDGSPLNGAFTVELKPLISESPIEYWIYGHSHRNIDAVIGKTKCVSNQLGYVFQNEHLTFNPEKNIVIE
jgi:hypothetical protein